MTMTRSDITELWKELKTRAEAGDRFAGLFATRGAGGTLVLSAHVATADGSTRWKRRCRLARPVTRL